MEFLGQMLVQALERLLRGDPETWLTAWRTVRLALESTAIALLIGLPIGCWLGETRTRARRALVTVANAGLGLPPVVLGIFLALLLIPGGALDWLGWNDTLAGMVFAQTLLALPIVIALTAAAVGGLPSGLLDQARAFGASWPRRALLALQEARVGVLAAVIAALGSALAEVGAVIIVGGNVRGQTNTLASTVLLDLSAADFAGATAAVLVLVVLVVLMAGGLTRVQQRMAR